MAGRVTLGMGQVDVFPEDECAGLYFRYVLRTPSEEDISELQWTTTHTTECVAGDFLYNVDLTTLDLTKGITSGNDIMQLVASTLELQAFVESAGEGAMATESKEGVKAETSTDINSNGTTQGKLVATSSVSFAELFEARGVVHCTVDMQMVGMEESTVEGQEEKEQETGVELLRLERLSVDLEITCNDELTSFIRDGRVMTISGGKLLNVPDWWTTQQQQLQSTSVVGGVISQSDQDEEDETQFDLCVILPSESEPGSQKTQRLVLRSGTMVHPKLNTDSAFAGDDSTNSSQNVTEGQDGLPPTKDETTQSIENASSTTGASHPSDTLHTCELDWGDQQGKLFLVPSMVTRLRDCLRQGTELTVLVMRAGSHANESITEVVDENKVEAVAEIQDSQIDERTKENCKSEIENEHDIRGAADVSSLSSPTTTTIDITCAGWCFKPYVPPAKVEDTDSRPTSKDSKSSKASRRSSTKKKTSVAATGKSTPKKSPTQKKDGEKAAPEAETNEAAAAAAVESSERLAEVEVPIERVDMPLSFSLSFNLPLVEKAEKTPNRLPTISDLIAPRAEPVLAPPSPEEKLESAIEELVRALVREYAAFEDKRAQDLAQVSETDPSSSSDTFAKLSARGGSKSMIISKGSSQASMALSRSNSSFQNSAARIKLSANTAALVARSASIFSGAGQAYMENKRMVVHNLNMSGLYANVRPKLRQGVCELVHKHFPQSGGNGSITTDGGGDGVGRPEEDIGVISSKAYAHVMQFAHRILNKQIEAVHRSAADKDTPWEFMDASWVNEFEEADDDLNRLAGAALDNQALLKWQRADSIHQARVGLAERTLDRAYAGGDSTVSAEWRERVTRVWCEYALFCLQRGQAFFSLAGECLRSAIAISQECSAAMFVYGALALQQGDVIVATVFAEATVRLLSNTPPKNRSFGRVFPLSASSDGGFSDSDDNRNGVSRNPEEVHANCMAIATALQALAKRHSGEKDADGQHGKRKNKDAYVNDPGLENALMKLAYESMCLGLFLAALKAAAYAEELKTSRLGSVQAVARNQTHDALVERCLLGGWAALQCGQLVDAHTQLERCTSLEPLHGLAWCLLGHCQAAQGRDDETADSLAKALAAIALGSRGKLACSAMTKTLVAGGLHTERIGRITLGALLVNRQQYIDAIHILKPTVAAKLCAPAAWRWAGVAALQVGDLDEAELALAESNALDNRDPETWALLTFLCLETRANGECERLVDADKCFELALELGLSNHALLHQVARSYRAVGRLAFAEGALRQAARCMEQETNEKGHSEGVNIECDDVNGEHEERGLVVHLREPASEWQVQLELAQVLADQCLLEEATELLAQLGDTAVSPADQSVVDQEVERVSHLAMTW